MQKNISYVTLAFLLWPGFTMCTESISTKNKEIEIKFHFDNQIDEKKFTDYIENYGVLKKKVKQNEFYLVGPETTIEFNKSLGFQDAQNTLRVRAEQSLNNSNAPVKLSTTVKKRHLDEDGKTVSRDEFEVSISDYKAMLQLYATLGYYRHTQVEKVRTAYILGNMEIAFDNVAELGSFFEIELIKNPETVQKGYNSIYEFLEKEVGIERITEFDRSYVHMIWNPNYNFGTTKHFTKK